MDQTDNPFQPPLSSVEASSITADDKPWLFSYSVLFPALWLLLGFSNQFLFPEKRSGIVLLFAVVYLYLFIICWHFSKHFKRQFSKSELKRLITYCSLWAMLCESLALFQFTKAGGAVTPLETKILIAVIFVSTCGDILLISIATVFNSKRIIRYFLKHQHSQTASGMGL